MLVRLGAYAFEKTEYADELVEAVEPCRSGLSVESISVCARLRAGFDIARSSKWLPECDTHQRGAGSTRFCSVEQCMPAPNHTILTIACK